MGRVTNNVLMVSLAKSEAALTEEGQRVRPRTCRRPSTFVKPFDSLNELKREEDIFSFLFFFAATAAVNH